MSTGGIFEGCVNLVTAAAKILVILVCVHLA